MLGYIGDRYPHHSGTAFSTIFVVALVGNMAINKTFGYIAHESRHRAISEGDARPVGMLRGAVAFCVVRRNCTSAFTTKHIMKYSSHTQWLDNTRAVMDRIEQTQTENIRRAAEVMADSIEAGRWVHTFRLRPRHDSRSRKCIRGSAGSSAFIRWSSCR